MVLIFLKFKIREDQKVKKRSLVGKLNSMPGEYSIKWKYKISANCFESSNWQFRNFLFEFGSKWLYNRKSEGPKIDPTELSQVQTIQV